MKTIFRLTMKSATRDTFLLFWSLILPIGGCIALGVFIKTPNYPQRIMVAMSASSVLFYAFMTISYVIMSQRRRGVYNLLRVTPMKLWKYVVSVGSAWTLIAAVCGLLVISVSVPLFKLNYSLLAMLACIPVTLIAAISYVFFSFFVSSLVKTEAHMSMITNLISLPLLFLSDGFYSLEGAPVILQVIRRFNPLQWFVSGLRAALNLDFNKYLINSGLLLMTLILTTFLAIKAFKDTDS